MRTNFFKLKIPLLYLFLVLGFSWSVQAQQINVRGVVSDLSGEPLPGVNIVVKGTLQGVMTDPNGNYQISVPGSDAILMFSYIGYISQEVTVGNQNEINISLKEDLQQIDEVVVIGYGTVTKKDVTTAVSTVSTKDIDERPIVSAAQALQGKAAGVNVYSPSGAPGGEMVVRVRGTTSFNGSNSPLYVVDGVPVDNLNFLSPQDIASMLPMV